MNLSLKRIRVALGIFMIAWACFSFAVIDNLRLSKWIDFLILLPRLGFLGMGIWLIAIRNQPAKRHSSGKVILFLFFVILAVMYIFFRFVW